jgi:uncharacterized protein (TIGR03000 family)
MKLLAAILALSLIAPCCGASIVVPAVASEEKAILVVVWLPADAELEMVGQKMPGMGNVRRFQSPPLEVGKDFTYTFKATWKEDGKPRIAKKEVKVRAGQTIEVDLYPENELTTDEKSVLELVNKERTKAGLTPLKAHPKLCRAARSHSANMAAKNTLAHTLDGKSFSQRIDDTGYRCGEAGENCAEGARTPTDAMQMWMTSTAGHRENILNPHYKDIGIGIGTTRDGKRYWTQLFATPASE